MDGSVRNRITNHLIESNPEFKSSLGECYNMANQFEQLIEEDVLPQCDDIHYRKLLLEEMKLVHVFKESFLMTIQVSQEFAIKQSKTQH